MTSREIKDAKAIDLSVNGWLQEIAYQLARLNEKQDVKPPEMRPPGKTKAVN